MGIADHVLQDPAAAVIPSSAVGMSGGGSQTGRISSPASSSELVDSVERRAIEARKVCGQRRIRSHHR
jgi:hypothetical protein